MARMTDMKQMVLEQLNLLADDANKLRQRVEHVHQMLQLLETPELPLTGPVPAAIRAAVGVGRCGACGHTEEAHQYGRAPGCSLCDCRAYVPITAEADSSRRSPAEADRGQVREMMPPAPLADRGLDPEDVCECGHTRKLHCMFKGNSETWCGKNRCNCQEFRLFSPGYNAETKAQERKDHAAPGAAQHPIVAAVANMHPAGREEWLSQCHALLTGEILHEVKAIREMGKVTA